MDDSICIERRVIVAENFRTGKNLVHACEKAAEELGMNQQKTEVKSDEYYLLYTDRSVIKTTKYLHTNIILTGKNGFSLTLSKLKEDDVSQAEMIIRYSTDMEKLVEEYLGLVAKKLRNIL